MSPIMPAPLSPFRFLPLIVLPWLVPAALGQSIADALDAPSLAWNNPAGTLVQNDVSFDGVDAVRLTRTGTTALSVTITGPARIEMQVRTSTEANADWFEASVGGLMQARRSGEQPWQKVTLEVPAGSQRVDLLYRKDAMTAHGADSVWVDAVQVLPAQPLSIAEAVEANFPSGITVTTEAAGWFTLPSTELSAEGGDVLVLAPSPATATTSAARLRLPVTGRGRLSLALNFIGTGVPTYVTPEFPLRWLSYSTPALTVGSYTTLEFIQPLNAPVPAVNLVIPIPANTMALVDQVRWTPLPAVSMGAALEAESLPWQSAGGVMAVESAEESNDGTDAVIFYDTGAAVTLPLTGPAQVTWVSKNDPAFTVDGSTRTGTSVAALPDGWTRHSYLVPPGNRTLRWQTKGTISTAYDQHGRLDTVTVTPLTTVSIPEATDAPGLTWTTAPNTTLGGLGGGGDAVQDGDAVRCLVIQPTNDWVEAAGSGAGRLHFAWGGNMTCVVNGVSALTGPVPSDSSALTRGVIEVPAGDWITRWTTTSSSTLIPGLDAVSFSAGENETLSRITDCAAGVSVVAARGQRSAGPVEGWAGAPGRQLYVEGTPAVMLQTTGSGVLRLRAWTTAGTIISWGTGQVATAGDWQDLEFPINGTAGQSLRTTLSIYSGNLLVVDGIIWTTGSTYSSEEAMDTPGLSWTSTHTGATDGWVGRTAPAAATNPGGGEAMTVPSLSSGASARLTATMQGTGWLSWWQKVPSGVLLKVLVDGSEAATRTGEFSGSWERGYAEVTSSGAHELIFEASNTGTGATMVCAVSGVRLDAWSVVTGAQLAEVPASWVLRSTPHRRWEGVTSVSDPSHPHFLAPLFSTAPTVLEADIQGPAFVTLYTSSRQVFVNGLLASSSSNWRYVTLSLPLAGTNTVRLASAKDESAGLDLATYELVSSSTIGDALDLPGWNWSTQGSSWVDIPRSLSHDGVDAAGFKGIAGVTGTLTAPYPGPGLFSFWQRSVIPFPNPDPTFTWPGPGSLIERSESSGWRQFTVSMTATSGAPLRWLVPIGNTPMAPASAWLDEMSFFPYTSASLGEALDTPGITWATNPTAPWRATVDPSGTGDAADLIVSSPSGSDRYVQTTLTLPVWLEYDTFQANSQLEINPSSDGPVIGAPSPPATTTGKLRPRFLMAGTGNSAVSLSMSAASNFAARLDRVFIGRRVGLAEAMDTPGLIWTANDSAAPGGLQIPASRNGGDAVIMEMAHAVLVPYSISTTVTGPGTISLQWMAESWDGRYRGIPAYLRVDGQTTRIMELGAGWEKVKHRISAGPHIITVEAPSAEYFVLADDFQFTAGGVDPVAAAMDMPSASFGSSGELPWNVINDPSAAGGTAMQTPAGAAPDSMQTLATAVQGAGNLQFSWRMNPGSAQVPPAELTLFIDGHPAWTAFPADGWTSAIVPLPGDWSHSLVWQWTAGAAQAQATVDALSLTPFSTVPLAEALDTPGRMWTSLPCANCGGIAGAPAGYDGTDAVRMELPSTTAPSSISTTITGPAKISFRWFRDFEAASNFTFYAGDYWRIKTGAARQWELVEAGLPAGQHILSWQFNGSSAHPASVMLDSVVITPGSPAASLAAALDIAGISLVDATGWQAVPFPVQKGEHSLVDRLSRPAILRLPGSGVLEFSAITPNNSPPSSGDHVNITSLFIETIGRAPSGIPGLEFIRYRWTIGAGTGTNTTVSIKLTNGSDMTPVLDDVQWTPQRTVPLDEALDSPGTNWTTGGTPGWQGYSFSITSPGGSVPPDLTSDVVVLPIGATPGDSWLEANVDGPFSLVIAGLTGASLRFEVDGVDVTSGTKDALYVLTPGPHRVRLLSEGLLVSAPLVLNSATITGNPPPPSWLTPPGIAVTLSPGRWRSQLPTSGFTLPALSPLDGTAAATIRVEGPGALTFSLIREGTLSAGTDFMVPLPSDGVWHDYRLEIPDTGPHDVRLAVNASSAIANFSWQPGPPVFSSACGFQEMSLFSPPGYMSVMPGSDALFANVPGQVTGLIATRTPAAVLATWWQHTLPPGLYSSRITSPSTNAAITVSNEGEAGPPPGATVTPPWAPRRMSWQPGLNSLRWNLRGQVCFGNFHFTPQTVPLEEALDLPSGVTAAAVSPDSATGWAAPSAVGGDAAALRPGEERALAFTTTGPGILSFDKFELAEFGTSSLPLHIRVDSLPAVALFSSRIHVLLSSGPHTVTLGGPPVTGRPQRIDNVAYLPLPFDPVAALGSSAPLVVTTAAEPATWPFVTSGGAEGMSIFGTESLYSASGGPARVTFRSASGAVTGITNYITPPAQSEQLWPAGVQALWLDRAASVRVFGGYAGLQTFVDDYRLDAAPAVTFPQALDANGLTFTASAGVLAHALPQGAVFDGDAAAFALGIAPRTLQTQVTGPGRLRFWWRTLTPQANAITCRVGGAAAVSQDTGTWKQADLAVPAGAQNVVWTVAANLSSAELDRVEFFPQWTFTTWSAQNALASLPTIPARAADDSDGDGAAGLLEYAFGLNPGAADFATFAGSETGPENARGLPALRVTRALDGLTYLELHFPRRLNSGLTYQMQATADPAAWQNTGALEVLRPLGADWELCRTRDTLPLDPARTRRLIRLRVTQP